MINYLKEVTNEWKKKGNSRPSEKLTTWMKNRQSRWDSEKKKQINRNVRDEKIKQIQNTMKSITNKLIKEKREYQKVKTRLKKYYKQQ
jgi:hypothetical protein